MLLPVAPQYYSSNNKAEITVDVVGRDSINKW
jgi:hypothetical protein